MILYLILFIFTLIYFFKPKIFENYKNFPLQLNIGIISLDSILPYTRSDIYIPSIYDNGQYIFQKKIIFKQIIRENPNIYKSSKLPLIPPSSYNKFNTIKVPQYIHCIIEAFQKIKDYKFRYFIYTSITEMKLDLIKGNIDFMISPNFKNFIKKNTLKIKTVGKLFQMIPICVNCKNKKYFTENLLSTRKNSFSFYLLDNNYNFKYYFDEHGKKNYIYYVIEKSNNTQDNNLIPVFVYSASPLNHKFLPKKVLMNIKKNLFQSVHEM